MSQADAPAPKPQRGRFISLEGGEGAGKTTQIARLAELLHEQHGLDVLTTREPGGTPGAEAIRALLVDGAQNRWSVAAEALLMIAARVDHWQRVIAPALNDGRWVVCDRFIDSTMAYQGIAGGLGRDAVSAIHQAVLPGVAPDLTLVLDIPVDVGLKRAIARAETRGEEPSRFEHYAFDHHTQIAQAFGVIADEEPMRVRRVDARGSVEVVAERIWDEVGPWAGATLGEGV